MVLQEEPKHPGGDQDRQHAGDPEEDRGGWDPRSGSPVKRHIERNQRKKGEKVQGRKVDTNSSLGVTHRISFQDAVLSFLGLIKWSLWWLCPYIVPIDQFATYRTINSYPTEVAIIVIQFSSFSSLVFQEHLPRRQMSGSQVYLKTSDFDVSYRSGSPWFPKRQCHDNGTGLLVSAQHHSTAIRQVHCYKKFNCLLLNRYIQVRLNHNPYFWSSLGEIHGVNYDWLVVYLPLWKILVSWDDDYSQLNGKLFKIPWFRSPPIRW